MKFCRDKRIAQMVADLVRDGWTFSHPSRGYPRVTAPSGAWVSFAWTPSDGNAFRQFERDVRKAKAGVEIRPKSIPA